MEINFFDETKQVSTQEQKKIEALLQFAANYLKLSDAVEMSVTFMDNAAIQKINHQYRNKEMPTDVISFAFEEELEEAPAIIFDEELMADFEMPQILGDLMISTERAKEQALDYGHSYERELGFLALHGFLHLNGYDHLTESDEKTMFGLQKEILDAYGLQR